MSDWTVHLEFEEGTSSKFWRVRVEGKTLYINYGRIGTTGQTQIKELSDPAAALRECEKLVREKRKKGYVDSSGGGGEEDEGEDRDEDDEDQDEEGEGDGDEDEDDRPRRKPAAKPAAPARSGGGLRMVLESGDRRVETTLYLDGKTVRMDAVESHGSADDAKQAYERLKRALAGEGYREG